MDQLTRLLPESSHAVAHDCVLCRCDEQAVPERCPRFDLAEWHWQYDETLEPADATPAPTLVTPAFSPLGRA